MSFFVFVLPQVLSVCLSSFQGVSPFLCLYKSPKEGLLLLLQLLQHFDLLLLLHIASSVALYIHLTKGRLLLKKKSLFSSLHSLANTFDLVAA